MNSFSRALILAAFFICCPLSALLARMPETIEGETRRDYRQVWFFYESYRAPGQEEVIWRLPLPFYGRYTNAERAYSFHHSLYPFYFNHGTNYWRKWSFFFLFTGDDKYHKDTRQDRDFFLTPILSWGSGDSKKERYFSFFPFFGTIKNKLAFSEINYFMFPLYANWSHKEYKAHGLLWAIFFPIIMWGGDSVRSDLRIFPFYSHKIYRGRYDKRTVAWPFVQWGEVDLHKKEPRKFVFIWPLYARKWSKYGNLNVHGIMPLGILPPLVAWGYDRRVNAKAFNFLWFFYQYETSDSPYIRKHIIFPFWGYYRFAHKELSFVGPFYANLKTHSLIFESDTTIIGPVVPMYWKTKRFYLKDWRETTFLKVWPFFHYIDDGQGNKAFRTLVLWPTRAEKFERYWGPLYSLFEYRSYANGDRYASLLFRSFSRYWNEEEERWFILGFEFHFTPRYWYVGFMGGLLGYRHDYARLNELTGKRLPSKNTVELFYFRI